MDNSIPTRASLLCRLKDWQDQSSWQEFFDTYWRLIYRVAIKRGLSESEAEDVVQETMVAVARYMPGFHYDPALGSFKSWLLNLTRWRIADHCRSRARFPTSLPEDDEAGTNTSVIDKVADDSDQELTTIWNAEWEKNLIESAMARVKRQVDPERFQIFDLYVNKQWPPARVAETLGISITQVYLAKHRITDAIKEEVRRLELKLL
jgi:RNA polymerase sigma factor (sigma-70 family)